MYARVRGLVFAWLLLALAAAPAPALAADNPFRPKLPFKTAIIKYELRGSEKGAATLYVDGEKSAKHTESSLAIMGMNQAKKSIHITTPEQVIEVDLIQKKATATGNMTTYLAQRYEKLSAAEQANVRQNAEKMGASLMTSFMGGGGKPQIQEGSFKGKPVQIVTVMGMTSYTWKDTPITLKTSGSMMGMQMDQEAVDIQTNVAVPANAMAVPGGIPVVFDKQADQMQRRMADNMLNMLKDPNFEQKAQSQQGGMMGGVLGGMLQGMDKDGEPAEMPQGMGPGMGQGQGMPQNMPPEVEKMLQEMQQRQQRGQ
ncbi:MAG: hypothetical protein V1797_14285 [Pseudomonadota bacterium]